MLSNRPARAATVAALWLGIICSTSAQDSLFKILTEGTNEFSDDRVRSFVEPPGFDNLAQAAPLQTWEIVAKSLRDSKAEGYSHHFITLYHTEILGKSEEMEWYIRKGGGPLTKVKGAGIHDVPEWQALGNTRLQTSEGVMTIKPYGLSVGGSVEPGHWYRGHATSTGVGVWESHPGQRHGLKLWLRPSIDWSTLQPLPSEVGEFGRGSVSQFRVDASATVLGRSFTLPGSVYLANTRYSSRTRKDGLYRGIVQLGTGEQRSFGAIRLARDQPQLLKFNHVTLVKIP